MCPLGNRTILVEPTEDKIILTHWATRFLFFSSSGKMKVKKPKPHATSYREPKQSQVKVLKYGFTKTIPT